MNRSCSSASIVFLFFFCQVNDRWILRLVIAIDSNQQKIHILLIRVLDISRECGMDGEYTNRTLPTKWWITRHSQSSFNNTEITRWRAQGTTPQGLQVYVVDDSPYHEELYPHTRSSFVWMQSTQQVPSIFFFQSFIIRRVSGYYTTAAQNIHPSKYILHHYRVCVFYIKGKLVCEKFRFLFECKVSPSSQCIPEMQCRANKQKNEPFFHGRNEVYILV